MLYHSFKMALFVSLVFGLGLGVLFFLWLTKFSTFGGGASRAFLLSCAVCGVLFCVMFGYERAKSRCQNCFEAFSVKALKVERLTQSEESYVKDEHKNGVTIERFLEGEEVVEFQCERCGHKHSQKRHYKEKLN